MNVRASTAATAVQSTEPATTAATSQASHPPSSSAHRKESQMTERSSRQSREAASSLLTPMNFMTDIARKQMSVMTNAASTFFRSGESMRKAQQQAAHQATLRYAQASDRLREDCEPAELMSIQTDLLRFDVQETARYWQQLTAAALQAQIEMMSAATHVFDTEGSSSFKSAIEAFQSAIPMAAPFFSSHTNGAAHAPSSASAAASRGA